jgi:hypothetical protein
LNCSILDSMSLRASVRFFLSLMSFRPSHVLIWSRCRCSFLISFFRSCSYFSCCGDDDWGVGQRRSASVTTHGSRSRRAQPINPPNQ